MAGRSPGAPAPDTALIEVLHEAVLVLNLLGEVSYGNRAAALVLQREAQSLIGENLDQLFDPATAAGLKGLLWSGFEGTAAMDVRLRDQRRVSLSVARPDAERVLLCLRDVTYAHRIEEALFYARRQASLGRLSAALAHDINGPLSVILGRIELLSGAPEGQPESARRHMRVIREHAGRIGLLVSNLQSFAARRTPERAPISMLAAVAGARERCGRRLDRVRLSVLIDPAGSAEAAGSAVEIPEDFVYHGDLDLIPQMLASLLAFGADRSPMGEPLRLHLRSDPGGGLRVSVQDHSEGLPEVVLRELRSPYTDERGVDPGVGLDLALAWAIAQDHGGWLQAENRPDRGASIHLWLPGPPAPLAAPDEPAHREELQILVVDDDQLLCETVSWMLDGEGYRIVALPSAEDALAQLPRADFDVILVDIRLPGMDGETFVDRVEESWPSLARRTVLTSGLLHLPRRSNLYLQKPFHRVQLIETLRRARTQG